MDERTFDVVRTLRDRNHPSRFIKFTGVGDAMTFAEACDAANGKGADAYDRIGARLPSEFMYGDDAPDDADVYLAGCEVAPLSALTFDQSGFVAQNLD